MTSLHPRTSRWWLSQLSILTLLLDKTYCCPCRSRVSPPSSLTPHTHIQMCARTHVDAHGRRNGFDSARQERLVTVTYRHTNECNLLQPLKQSPMSMTFSFRWSFLSADMQAGARPRRGKKHILAVLLRKSVRQPSRSQMPGVPFPSSVNVSFVK